MVMRRESVIAGRPGAPLEAAVAQERAARLRLVLSDCDGVLTDQGVYYSDNGEALKRFSIRDGMGVERLRNAGITTAIVSGERSPSIARRAEKLGIRAFLGVRDKAVQLDAILAELGVDLDQVAYVGDDVNDLAIMRRIAPSGLVAAPGDAMAEVIAEVNFVSEALAGHGAFRGVVEWILELRRAAELTRALKQETLAAQVGIGDGEERAT
jgi:3-deoxy-D-manno-octulosonate 8-phosphate phosphatase (KDO 8-P phosphatase)